MTGASDRLVFRDGRPRFRLQVEDVDAAIGEVVLLAVYDVDAIVEDCRRVSESFRDGLGSVELVPLERARVEAVDVEIGGMVEFRPVAAEAENERAARHFDERLIDALVSAVDSSRPAKHFSRRGATSALIATRLASGRQSVAWRNAHSVPCPTPPTPRAWRQRRAHALVITRPGPMDVNS